ncbi:hypothetical protein HanXRQr2_Chr08g0351221 [Helianthus annuus]|uniref:Uncharacterized protein n=1 Tax=Helianthus annuus TaxID=4232 RepID=A0A9K3IGF5_HELAN|nr:hypothetical protein HanXRQr2_Chr08g0351221 [Helianthus annuus]
MTRKAGMTRLKAISCFQLLMPSLRRPPLLKVCCATWGLTLRRRKRNL